MDSTVDENHLDPSRSITNSSHRRRMHIETEVRTDSASRQRLLTNSSISSRSVLDILENTKSPTEGLPQTTYTYARSVSYVPVTENALCDYPVMARRNLRTGGVEAHVTQHDSALYSPKRLVSTFQTQIYNGYSAIRNRFTDREHNSSANHLENSLAPQDSTKVYSNSMSSSYNLRRRPPVHSTPRDLAFEQKAESITNEQNTSIIREQNYVPPQSKPAQKSTMNPFTLIGRVIKALFSSPYWILLLLFLFLGLIFAPELICRSYNTNDSFGIRQTCESYEKIRKEFQQNLAILNEKLFIWSKKIYNTGVNMFKEFMQKDETPTPPSSSAPTPKDLPKCATVEAASCECNVTDIVRRAMALLGSEEKPSVEQIPMNKFDENELKAYIRSVLEEYGADETGKADFALQANGGKIVETRCDEYIGEPVQVVRIFGIPITELSRKPETMIQPGRLPGQCFPFRGSQANITIRLASVIEPTEFVLEHMPKKLSTSGKIISAPKNFSVHALENETDTVGIFLGEYFYNAEDDSAIQFFQPKNNVSNVEYIQLRVLSNWGNPDYTCLYRFRVHGNKPSSKSDA